MSIAIDLQFLKTEIKVTQSEPVFPGIWVYPSFEAVFGEFSVVSDSFHVIADQVVVVDVQSAVLVFLVVKEHCTWAPGL